MVVGLLRVSPTCFMVWLSEISELVLPAGMAVRIAA